jgi:hypothetical protein
LITAKVQGYDYELRWGPAGGDERLKNAGFAAGGHEILAKA